MSKKIYSCIFILFVIILTVWIFLNPYSDVYTLKENFGILNRTNTILGLLGLSYKFTIDDFSCLARFWEYFLFGVFLSAVLRRFMKDVLKNIFTPLFIGLAVPVTETYYKSLRHFNVNIDSVILSFLAFCIGLCVYLIFNRKCFTKKTNLKRGMKYARY